MRELMRLCACSALPSLNEDLTKVNQKFDEGKAQHL